MTKTASFKTAYVILYSVIISFSSFAIIRVVNNLILSIFLKINNIYHEYNYFSIEYKNGRIENWTEGELILINTIPYLCALLIGIYLPHFIRRMKSRIIKLTITWFSFHLVILFLAGLVSGLFEYKGLGIALEWFIELKALQVIVVLIVSLSILWSSKRFAWYFLRCFPECIKNFDYDIKYSFLRKFALIPFILSSLLIIPFSGIETVLNDSISFLTGLAVIGLLFSAVPYIYLPQEI